MKRAFSLFLVFILGISLCACSEGTRTDMQPSMETGTSDDNEKTIRDDIVTDVQPSAEAGTSDDNEKTIRDDIVTDVQPSTEAGTSDDNEKTIGDITIVDNFECQIKEVNWYSSSDFDPAFLEPEDGFEYIVIVLSEKNTTSETENAPMLSLLSADGKECISKAGLSLYKNQYKINFGATLPGAAAEAYVIYQIPVGAESFVLQILSNGFGSNSDYIVFDRNDIQ